MKRVMIATALVLGLSAPAQAATACLERPSSQITVVPAGTYGTDINRIRLVPPGDNHTLDARGARWLWDMRPEKKPVAVYQRLNGSCISGPTIIGTQPTDALWDDVKNSDGPRHVHEEPATIGPMTLEGAYTYNVGDGYEPARYSNAAGLGYTFTLKDSYFDWIRDDVVENDACNPGLIQNVLIDRSFTFVSTRPGSGTYLTLPMAPVIQIYDTLVHIAAMPGGNGRLWKWPGSSSGCSPTPQVDVRNSIFRVDVSHSTMDFPPGTYQNVTVVWTGGGSFPVPVPPGVAVTADLSIWNNARNEWLSRHGCDLVNQVCTNLLDGTTEPPPPQPPPPPPPVEQTVDIVATADTYLRKASPGSSFGSRTTVNVDSTDGKGPAQGLLYFDISAIPLGSDVVSAMLTLRTTDGGSGAAFHQMLRSWIEADTWNSLSSGISTNNVEAASTADFSTGSMSTGSRSFDVTLPVQDWVDGVLNHGWALMPLGGNSWGFYSRQGAVPPVLTVTYVPPA